MPTGCSAVMVNTTNGHPLSTYAYAHHLGVERFHSLATDKCENISFYYYVSIAVERQPLKAAGAADDGARPGGGRWTHFSTKRKETIHGALFAHGRGNGSKETSQESHYVSCSPTNHTIKANKFSTMYEVNRGTWGQDSPLFDQKRFIPRIIAMSKLYTKFCAIKIRNGIASKSERSSMVPCF